MAQLLEMDEGTDDDMPELVDMDDEGDEGDNRVVCCLEGCHSGGGAQELQTMHPQVSSRIKNTLP